MLSAVHTETIQRWITDQHGARDTEDKPGQCCAAVEVPGRPRSVTVPLYGPASSGKNNKHHVNELRTRTYSWKYECLQGKSFKSIKIIEIWCAIHKFYMLNALNFDTIS